MFLFGKKKKEIELDLPPPPPLENLEHDTNEIDSFPSIKGQMISEHEIESAKKDYDQPIKKRFMDDGIPPLPDLEDLEKELLPPPDIDELKNELFGSYNSSGDLKLFKEDTHKFDMPEIHPERDEPAINGGPISDEHLAQDIHERPRNKEGHVFVRVTSYKDSLSDVNLIRSKIKETQDCLKRMNEIKNSKDKYLEQFRSKLEDLQRKSLYVDKSLFEGGIRND